MQERERERSLPTSWICSQNCLDPCSKTLRRQFHHPQHSPIPRLPRWTFFERCIFVAQRGPRRYKTGIPPTEWWCSQHLVFVGKRQETKHDFPRWQLQLCLWFLQGTQPTLGSCFRPALRTGRAFFFIGEGRARVPCISASRKHTFTS